MWGNKFMDECFLLFCQGASTCLCVTSGIIESVVTGLSNFPNNVSELIKSGARLKLVVVFRKCLLRVSPISKGFVI